MIKIHLEHADRWETNINYNIKFNIKRLGVIVSDKKSGRTVIYRSNKKPASYKLHRELIFTNRNQ
jgi:hypothetical protein